MSILIKDMEMPTRCADCWLLDGEDRWCCACRGKHVEPDYRYGIKDRPDWCPLVEVPAHGRLVDADAFAEEMKKRQCRRSDGERNDSGTGALCGLCRKAKKRDGGSDEVKDAEKLALKEQPERVMEGYLGGVGGCPRDIMADAKELCEKDECPRSGNEDKCRMCWNQEISDQTSQEAKADKGKPRLTLVPRRIIWDIAEIREYGTEKYHDPENWRRVEPERYRDAAYRHFMAYLDDPYGVDAESGLPHLWHLACNIAFLCELEGPQIYEPKEEER